MRNIQLMRIMHLTLLSASFTVGACVDKDQGTPEIKLRADGANRGWGSYFLQQLVVLDEQSSHASVWCYNRR